MEEGRKEFTLRWNLGWRCELGWRMIEWRLATAASGGRQQPTATLTGGY